MYSHKPGFDQTKLAQVLNNAEYAFLGVFGTEMVLKIIAMGLVMDPGTYLRNGACTTQLGQQQYSHSKLEQTRYCNQAGWSQAAQQCWWYICSRDAANGI